MPGRLLHRPVTLGRTGARGLRRRLPAATRPAIARLVVGTLAALARSQRAPVAEHACLRHQLAILRRSVRHPRRRPADRALLVLLASRVRAWRSALLIVQPDTLLRRQRRLFRGYWRRRSRTAVPAHRPPRAPEVIAPIKEMAAANRRWGAERIRGEWLKLDIRVATSTIRRHLRGARPPRRSGQSWPTFLRNHVGGIWARDFLPVTDCRFRQVCAFFVIDLGSRRVAHVGVTRRPTDAWVAQQLREAMPYGQQPTCLSRDNVRKYGPAFARVAAASGIAVLRTASRPPRHNASCERFLGSMRRECLELLLALGVAHLRRILREYSRYRTFDRPHLGLEERIPDIAEDGAAWTATGSGVLAIPVPGGLHHAHARAA